MLLKSRHPSVQKKTFGSSKNRPDCSGQRHRLNHFSNDSDFERYRWKTVLKSMFPILSKTNFMFCVSPFLPPENAFSLDMSKILTFSTE